MQPLKIKITTILFFRKEKIMNDLNFITHDPETIDVYGKRKKYYEYENYHDNYNENGKNVKFPIIGDVNIRLGNGDDRHDHQTGSYIAPYGEAYSIDTNHMFDR